LIIIENSFVTNGNNISPPSLERKALLIDNALFKLDIKCLYGSIVKLISLYVDFDDVVVREYCENRFVIFDLDEGMLS
jgi:hypothetical protein